MFYFDLKKLVLNKWFWALFSALMFGLPIYKSINRTLPPEIPKQFQIPDFTLQAENGSNFQWSSLKGKFVLVNFQFTRCPSICKELMIKTQEIQYSEQKMRLLVKNTPAAVAMFDNSMHYIVVSDRWIQDYNLQDRDIIVNQHCYGCTAGAGRSGDGATAN